MGEAFGINKILFLFYNLAMRSTVEQWDLWPRMLQIQAEKFKKQPKARCCPSLLTTCSFEQEKGLRDPVFDSPLFLPNLTQLYENSQIHSTLRILLTSWDIISIISKLGKVCYVVFIGSYKGRGCWQVLHWVYVSVRVCARIAVLFHFTALLWLQPNNPEIDYVMYTCILPFVH